MLDRLDDAAEQQAKFRVDLIREAVLFYMAENPDDIPAFAEVSHPARRRTSSEPEIEEAEVDVEEADLEADEADEAGGVVPYDPLEEF